MGIIKISEEMHQEVRKASQVMVRSINSQAEFWMKIGMLAELHPDKTYVQLIQLQLSQCQLTNEPQDQPEVLSHD